MKNPSPDEIAQAIRETLISPNVNDSNLEAANIVDAIDEGSRRIMNGLFSVANALREIAVNMNGGSDAAPRDK